MSGKKPNQLPPLETNDDQLPLRPCKGLWTYDKLYYLNAYIDRFIVSMRHKNWRAIHYIDLFAGPGKNSLPDGRIIAGSPLLALSQKHPFDRYFFSDLAPENINALKQRCALHAQSQKITFQVGDANEVVKQVIQDIHQIDRPRTDQWPSLNLAFLDPEGLELRWETVEKIAERRTDMIIYYSQMGITRDALQEIQQQPPSKIDLFFGDTGWRKIYQQHQRGEEAFLHRALLDYYKNKLGAFGYKVEDPLSEPIFTNSKNAPLYRLLFVCKSPLGNKFWADVTRNLPSGQLRLM